MGPLESRQFRELTRSGFGSATQSNDEVDAIDLHSRRGFGQPLELDVAQGNIHQRAGIEIVEVVVRVGVRIEPAAIATHGKLADEARGREQIQSVVDRGLGNAQTEPAQARQDLIGRKVLGSPEKQRSNAQPLRGGSYAMTQQALVQVLD